MCNELSLISLHYTKLQYIKLHYNLFFNLVCNEARFAVYLFLFLWIVFVGTVSLLSELSNSCLNNFCLVVHSLAWTTHPPFHPFSFSMLACQFIIKQIVLHQYVGRILIKP